MQILTQLPNGKNKRDPLTVDANGYILHNGQRIKDSQLRAEPISKSTMVRIELRKLDSKVPALVNIFKNASKRNQNIVRPLYDQHMSIVNLYTSEYEKADDKSRFQVRTYFYDEVKKLDPLIESIAKHVRHKPKTKFDTALLKYFCMVSSMRNMIRDIRECPVPRCDDQGFVMEPISTTNRDYKKRRAVKRFFDSYLAKTGELPRYLTVEKHLQKVLGQKWGVFKSGNKKPVEIHSTKSAAHSHKSRLGSDYQVNMMDSISDRTYREYKTEYRKGTIEWFFSNSDLILMKK